VTDKLPKTAVGLETDATTLDVIGVADKLPKTEFGFVVDAIALDVVGVTETDDPET